MVKNKNIVCIVQARLNSSRLPGKILKKINKKNIVLEFLIKRLKKSKKISKIIIACPDTNEDKKIIKKLKKYKVSLFQGSKLNVLDRYFKAAKKFKANVIIRITSDCPFSDPKLIDKFLEIFLKFKYDYFSNVNPPTFPDGFDIEIFNFKSLKFAWENANSNYDKEHVTPYLKKSNKINRGNFSLKQDYSKLRVTLDNQNDLKLIRHIAKELNPNKYFSWKKILGKLKKLQKNEIK